MYGFLLAVLVLDGIFMSVVILLQSGKGGGLAAVGGGAAMTEGILGGRQATTVLTRTTWITGAAFMILALVLSIMSSRARQPSSVIQVEAPTTAAPAPVLPGLGTQPATAEGAGTGNTDPGAASDPGNSGN
ncbi:MAG: preprotein translocase subunit SecG [Gemmatimonadota bacterium]|nr:preprotein translocase subunit SecG [Gemmatimonadota bacterium]